MPSRRKSNSYNNVSKVESLMLVGWCSMESSATCSIYCQTWERPASVPTAKMGSTLFPLCLMLLLCSVYGSPVSVSKTWFLQAPLSPEASHTLYSLYSILSRWNTPQVKLVSAVWAGLSFGGFPSTCCEPPHPNTMFWLSCRCWSWWGIQRHSRNQLGWVHA